MAEARDVSVVIPAFNEEAGIGAVIAGVKAAGPFREVVVVDDASTDQTAERARRGLVLRRAGADHEVVDADGLDDPADLRGIVLAVGVHEQHHVAPGLA